MKSKLLVFVVALTTAAGCAFAGVTLDVGYDFEAGDSSLNCVTATIDGAEMGRNVPLAVTGGAAVDVTLEVIGTDDAGIATLRATFGEIDATLMGDPQDAGTPSPVDLRVDRRGALVGVGSDASMKIDLFASGGVPLQLVVLLAGVVEMPEGPVGVGKNWTIERCQDIPEVGEVRMVATSRIVEIGGAEVLVETDIEASLPDITTANPLQGGDVTVQEGVLTIEGMKRVVNARTGLLESAEAEMKFNGFATAGPFPALPLSVNSTFKIAPVKEPNDG